VGSAASFSNIHINGVPMTAYRSNCRSCGGQLYVVSGDFQASPMPLHRDGFSFSEAKHVATENEVIHCSTCDSTLSLGDCVLQCLECNDKGWGHFEGNHGLEIQRCDCGMLPTDDDAKAAHELDCGCGWGEPWYRVLYEVTVKVTVAAPPDQAADIEKVVADHVEADLPGLVTDLPVGGLMHVCTAKTVGTETYDEHPRRKLLVEFGVLEGDE
jgi:hypothetical protein